MFEINMFIAAIDPGESIGVAIAKVSKAFQAEKRIILLEKYFLDTLKKTEDQPVYPVMSLMLQIKAANCKVAIIERQPMYPSNKLTVSYYEQIVHQLGEDFLTSPALGHTSLPKGWNLFHPDTPKQLILLGSSLWKTWAERTQNPDNLRVWHPKTRHEKDAMWMLYYWIYLVEGANVQEVLYV